MTNQHNINESTDSSNATDKNNKKNMLESASTGTVVIAVTLLVQKMIRAPLFTVGQVVATPGAIDLLDRSGMNASTLLARHQRGDWGVLCQSDALENTRSIKHSKRILSAYKLGKQQELLWVITERNRSVTTLLLSEEY